jgi:hypothetical protein
LFRHHSHDIEDVHIKKVDRAGLLNEIKAPHSLHHAQTVDKSKPKIERVKLKKVHRPWLADIKARVAKLKKVFA